MPQITVEIAGRNYPLSCREGDEPHVAALAADIAKKADSLLVSLGPMSEARVMLMSALMIADELHETRAGRAPVPPIVDRAADAALEGRLTALIARLNGLVARLEKKPAAA